MSIANQEAHRFNNAYVGTEFLFLGLIKEGTGVAANVLKNLGVDFCKFCNEVEKIVQAGPDMVTMGKLPHTPGAKKAIEYAIEEASNLTHNYVGTEHILLGLLRDEEGLPAQILMNLGLEPHEVRAEVLSILGCPTHPRDLPSLPSGQAGQPSNTGSLSTNDGELPDHCLACGGTRIARIHSGYSLAGLLDSDPHWRPWRSRIDGERELLGGTELLPSNASWACLDCRPGWLDVHHLAIEEEKCEGAKQQSVMSEDFVEAARWRDRRDAATAQIRALTAGWLAQRDRPVVPGSLARRTRAAERNADPVVGLIRRLPRRPHKR